MESTTYNTIYESLKQEALDEMYHKTKNHDNLLYFFSNSGASSIYTEDFGYKSIYKAQQYTDYEERTVEKRVKVGSKITENAYGTGYDSEDVYETHYEKETYPVIKNCSLYLFYKETKNPKKIDDIEDRYVEASKTREVPHAYEKSLKWIPIWGLITLILTCSIFGRGNRSFFLENRLYSLLPYFYILDYNSISNPISAIFVLMILATLFIIKIVFFLKLFRCMHQNKELKRYIDGNYVYGKTILLLNLISFLTTLFTLISLFSSAGIIPIVTTVSRAIFFVIEIASCIANIIYFKSQKKLSKTLTGDMIVQKAFKGTDIKSLNEALKIIQEDLIKY